MDFITDRIAIGNHVEGKDAELLSSNEITGILCVAGDRLFDPAPPGIEKDGWPLVDGRNVRSDVEGALRKLERLLSRHERVLVHCNAGKSRSCGLVALWLARHENMDLATAIARVVEKRPVAWIAPDLEETLREVV